ncbi:MAG: restriction endonuclease subunit S [Geobacteraceae bacterium]
MKTATYATYKSSNARWLGDIPSHWKVKKLKFLATVQPSNVDKKTVEGEEPVLLCNYTDVYKNEYIDSQLDFMRATATKDEIKKFSVDVGDVIVTKDSETPHDIAVPACVAEKIEGLLCGYHLTQIKPVDLDGRFLFRLFQSTGFSAQFTVAANGVTRFGLPQYAIANAFSPVPPIDEQEVIASFLDYKTAQIDALIAKKETLLTKLTEKRTALISHAVTKGLDPAVPMKDSGVEWLGEVPEHWDVKRIKYLTPVKRGASPRPIDDPRYFDEDGEYAWVRIADVSASERYLEKTTQRLSEIGQELSVKMNPGGLFLSIAGTVGKPIITKIKCCIHDGFVYFPWLKESIEFLYYIFSSGQPYLGLGKMGTQLNLNTDTVGSIKIGVPPIDEQNSIVDYLDKKTGKIDEQTQKIRKAIDSLLEYRSALITNAVTGKIDVRSFTPPEGEDVEANPTCPPLT